MATSSGSWLVCNGRLDHRAELCRKLGLTSARSQPISDGELIRLSWEKWELRLWEHLYGEYSLLVFNPERRSLVAMRGPLRSPPLFYFESRERIAVSSMPKGLFALGDVPVRLNEEHLADAMVLNFEDKHASYFTGIGSLPLGYMLIASDDSMKVSKFYDVRETPFLHLQRDDDYLDAADELLEAAVGSAMRALQTPTVSLSSGLDSTSVAVTALRLLSRGQGSQSRSLLGLVAVPEAGWSNRFADEGTAGDESGPVRVLAARYKDLDVRYADSAGLPIDYRLDDLIEAVDMPLRGVGSSHWSLDLDRISRAAGRRVMMSGSSGNATLSFGGGTAAHASLFRKGRWLRLLREVRSRNAALGNRHWFGFAGLRAPILAAAPRALFAAYAGLRKEEGWRSFSAIHPAFAAEMRVDARMRDLGWDDRRQPFADRRMQMSWMLNRGGRHESGAAIMGFQAVTGVELRDPLGDRKLAEFCYAIPDDQFYRDGIDRSLVRRLMAQRLPAEILNAPRGRQSADWQIRLIRDAMRFERELARLAENPLIARIIDLDRLQALLKRLPSHASGSEARQLNLQLAQYGFGRALGVARFIEAVQEKQ